MSEPLLNIKKLCAVYHTEAGLVHAVEGLDLQLEAGESLGLVGETGAGKTTTALCTMGLLPSPAGEVTAGEIYFEGENLLKMTERQLRRIRGGKIAMIFQDPMTSLNPVMTVDEQIAEMVSLHRSMNKRQSYDEAIEMLRLVGILSERARDYPHQFSGGMRQRVMIAIALACNPELLIADEPTTALDVTIQAQVLSLMKDLKKKFNSALIMITHSLGIVAEICDKVAIMYAGRVVERGTLREIFTDACHPYTRGLFNAVPDLSSEEKKPLHVIPGLMPDPIDLPEGCPFNPRCSMAQEICHTRVPELISVGSDSHYVACHLVKGAQ